MGQRYYLPLIAAVLFCACSGRADKAAAAYPYSVHPTTAMLDKNVLRDIRRRTRIPRHISVHALSEHIYPIAGTVSHHLLVAPLINFWFAELSRVRPVNTFIIISPRHFRQGRENISLSSRSWNSGNGLVQADKECIAYVLKRLRLPEDPEAMHLEHGVGALLPYIKHYFPKAKIVPIVIDEKNSKITDINRLAQAVHNLMKNRKDLFLLISTDFSHHADPETTEKRDEKTIHFLERPALARIPLVYSDNNKGLRVLAEVYQWFDLNAGSLLCHTDSFRYGGKEADDITSYFFYMWGRTAGE
jgi:MEMO1 family protein